MPASAPRIEHDCAAAADAGEGAPIRDSAISSETIIFVTRTRMGTRLDRVKSRALLSELRRICCQGALSHLRVGCNLRPSRFEGLTFQWLETRYGFEAKD